MYGHGNDLDSWFVHALSGSVQLVSAIIAISLPKYTGTIKCDRAICTCRDEKVDEEDDEEEQRKKAAEDQ